MSDRIYQYIAQQRTEASVHQALVIIPPSLEHDRTRTRFVERVGCWSGKSPVNITGSHDRLPQIIVCGPTHCRLRLDVTARVHPLLGKRYLAAGIVTGVIRGVASAYAAQIAPDISTEVCMINDVCLVYTRLRQLSVEMFLAGLKAGDLSRGRGLVYRERQPRPSQEERRSYF